ncbi:MAG: hypothetical protein KI790_02435 [Cyclobacteriaceae bacterium]|nr:hypothetical protein [Cyclobacteriaceae bacterium HetDA_MAG_MS6]
MNNLSPAFCLHCKKPLTGRSDKKFCDSHCRNTFNNQNKSKDEAYIQAVNARIRKNRRILKTLSPEGKATVRKDILDQMKYDFRYFSGIYKSKQLVYYLVYDYAFAPTTDQNGVEKAIIVQQQDYMDQLSFSIWRNNVQ